jgi:DNA polymerase IV (DinB-like DNA polymerase)
MMVEDIGIRIIGHLDMDAFFASLEERASPQFRGKPIVVGSDPKEGRGRGVVSTANYAARKYGISSALPISKAWALSQAASSKGLEPVVFLPSNFPMYERSSKAIHGIISRYSSSVEQGSIDEYYFDLSSLGSFARAKSICLSIKEDIRREEGVTCSIGIGPGKTIAKIAASLEKPDGLSVVEKADIPILFAGLSVRVVPGIGPKAEKSLCREGISTISDLLSLQVSEMEKLLGKTGLSIFEKIRGDNDSLLISHWETKSIGEQITFEEDILDPGMLIDNMMSLCEDVLSGFRKRAKRFKRMAITVRFQDFETISSSRTFPDYLSGDDKKGLKLEVLKVFMPFLDARRNPLRKPIRLIGLRLERFE